MSVVHINLWTSFLDHAKHLVNISYFFLSTTTRKSLHKLSFLNLT